MTSYTEPGLPYETVLISRSVSVLMREVGRGLRATLTRKLREQLEGKCAAEGFVRPGSTRIERYSAGVVRDGAVVITVGVTCDVCSPCEGDRIRCIVAGVNKAGIRAVVSNGDGQPTPVQIYVARDHHHGEAAFSSVQAGESLDVTVIGARYQLNDSAVSVIARLAAPTDLNKGTADQDTQDVDGSSQAGESEGQAPSLA